MANSLINLTSSTGRIFSPDSTGRGKYDKNVDIIWIIEAPDGLIIRFHIHFIQIQSSSNCFRDGLRVGHFLIVFDGE